MTSLKELVLLISSKILLLQRQIKVFKVLTN